MQDSEIEEILDECRKLRGLTDDLRHRTFGEFGWFLQDMVDFLIFNKTSEDEGLAKFQKAIKEKQDSYKPEDFKTYVGLFKEYWQQRPQLTPEEYALDLEALERLSKG